MAGGYLKVLCVLLAMALAGCKRSPSTDAVSVPPTTAASSDQFISLMHAGKNQLDQGEATNALATYKKALVIAPADLDLRLNLANAHLQAGDTASAIQEAEEALRIEQNSAAAWFIKGSAHLRNSNFEEAVKAFENVKKIDPGETATFFQLGLARMGLKQWEEAITAFRDGFQTDPNRLHAAAHYLLAQALRRAGREAEANQELQLHQGAIEVGEQGPNATTFERSRFTRARVPFRLDQPDKEGIKLTFVDATREVFGEVAARFTGPVGMIDVNHNGWMSLFVMEQGQGFRLLWNTNGAFLPKGPPIPFVSGANYHKMIVGDFQNDRFDDIAVLGDKGSHLFKFGTNGAVTEVTAAARLTNFAAIDGLVMDLDFTGKLDLIAISAASNNVRILRQFGPFLLVDITRTSGIPSSLGDAQAVAMSDWNRDEIMDVIVSRKEGPPLLLEKQRNGPFMERQPTNWVGGSVFTTGDFDNDLRADLAVFNAGKISICFNSGDRKEFAVAGASAARKLIAIDHDNDGWLDLWIAGEKLRAWRNTGLDGFVEQTSLLGLDKLAGAVSEMHFADFDQDCDSDVVMALGGGGLRFLRNEGGNANSQVKVQLIGNRSNSSGIGCKVEIETGGLRLIRTVHHWPVEIGVGKYNKLDSFLVHWFNWPQGSAEVEFNCKEPLFALEMTIPEGSCPYLYAWDGKTFRFVTDLLGAAPLGLPVAEGRYIESDPEEFVSIGNEDTFPPRDGSYQIQITEELREVLYLDEAKLVVVDREPGVEVHPTDKLLPGKPFPAGSLLTVHNEHRLQRAEMAGVDVTERLRQIDSVRVSPPKLRGPQLRGIAELHGVILDFGALDTMKPLVLVMNGWLRFGGGMANIAASHDPSLPFPFPILEAESSAGEWKKVDVTVGAPAGKTKTIVVDLAGKLEAGSRRLRLSQAFEIHWDRIALMEKKNSDTSFATIAPGKANLHFRGFSPFRDLPWDWPLTPDYDRVSTNWYWTVIPGGWCTRYGDVSELIARRDEALALMNAGDELTLEFSVSSMPPKPAGTVRDFFLYIDGWDKDSDFHVVAGTRVEPLPFHGMDDQLYGHQPRPKFPSDALNKKYNTRWVDSRALKQTAGR